MSVSGDEIELNAISKLFTHNINVSYTKSSNGHLLGAAGRVESIFSIMTINHKVSCRGKRAIGQSSDLLTSLPSKFLSSRCNA